MPTCAGSAMLPVAIGDSLHRRHATFPFRKIVYASCSLVMFMYLGSQNPVLKPWSMRLKTSLPSSLSNPICVKSGLNIGEGVELKMYVKYSCANRFACVASHGWIDGMMPAALNLSVSANSAG